MECSEAQGTGTRLGWPWLPAFAEAKRAELKAKGHGEYSEITQDEFLKLMALAQKGIARLVDLQKLAVA